jgi:two-component system, chemotaxis family, chemotaxis protein CheY
MSTKQAEKLIESLAILIVDESQYMRKLTRTMLMNIGAKTIYEAADGVAALDAIRSGNPDIAIIDWDLPVLSGSQVVKIVRSPGVFPKPHLPIIMLTGDADRTKVAEAMRLGVHEFLLKPTSPRALQERILSIIMKPRAMVHVGKFYVPEPRGSAVSQNEPRGSAASQNETRGAVAGQSEPHDNTAA